MIREKVISTETQKEELTEFMGKVQAILQLLEDIYQHEKEEWEFNQQLEGTEKNEDYEIIDSEILKWELEKEEWQNLLVKLEDKLTNLENQERQIQAQIVSNSWF
ncbi:MAG: hypothetical protein I3273_06835 [Candidatus Moeniiplasma glomeromycotorum]|nr:hypothetical protein [Candidatus Moeniiplasma glomeromycotorum]MCE8168156.1 hypothetical protein [Candidatus Moeniiplasma glomeromycotorum]MCE8169801.1 hypothetical protein [Candidatus Moeniiplasma glomeromycotorum]